MSFIGPPEDAIKSSKHIVFLGTHNANPFRQKIQDWLPNLDLRSTEFVIADNASSDGSATWLKALCSSLGATSHFLQNRRNYGGYGNLISTLEKFPEAMWITTLHQDDFYESNHIQVHLDLIRQSEPNLGMVCSEALSEDLNGYTIPYPRAIWLLENQLDPVTIFLAHLKQHVFPFSGASISTNVLRRFNVPWHSTAFPDTELVMKMIAEFGVKFAEGLTVRYLENPKSESHSLSRQQREFGAFVALIRVFSHPNFRKICDMVPIGARQHFYSSLQEGIASRFTDGTLRSAMNLTVLEIVAEHLSMDENLAALIADGYQRIGDYRAVGHLQVFSAKNQEIPRNLTQGDSIDVTDKTRGYGHKLILLLLRILPRNLRKRIFRFFMKSRLGKRLFPSWHLLWKRD